MGPIPLDKYHHIGTSQRSVRSFETKERFRWDILDEVDAREVDEHLVVIEKRRLRDYFESELSEE